MPFSHPLKKSCTALSPRELLLDEFELRLDDELEEELDEELDDEFEDELDEEFELPLELLFELLLPALILSGFTLCSRLCAASVNSFVDTKLGTCACVLVPPTSPATAVTMTPICCFIKKFSNSLKKVSHSGLGDCLNVRQLN